MEQIINFLNECGTFYLATSENNKPYVRPFGAVSNYQGRLYICTNNTKNVYKQMIVNPEVEISATGNGGRWIRLEGKVAPDHSYEAKAAMLEACPSLKNMYKADDSIFEVLYFTEGKAVISSFSAAPEEIHL